MSYQYKQPGVQVVVCDICNDFSWVGDRHWRAMPESSADRPIHLCPKCQRVAMWCSAHRQYHLADTFHRRTCVDCGGLFTSVVRDSITRCPACRRMAGDSAAESPARGQQRPRSLVRQLLSFRSDHRP